MRAGVALLGVVATAAWAEVLPGDAPTRVVLAQVAPKNEAIQAAQKALDEGEFEAVVRIIEKGIEQPDLTDDSLAELYRQLGLAHLYLGNEDKARDAFEKLLQARPDYELPKSTAPKIRTLYARIKEDIRKRRVRPVTLTLAPVPPAKGNEPVVVAAHIEDMALGAKAKLFYRRAGAQSFSSTDFLREKSARTEYRATIPAFEVPAEDASWELEYYVEVADAAQRRLAGRGDSFNPLSFRVAAKETRAGPVEEAPAWYKNPWVWVGVGVGAAAITTGAVLLATQRQTATLPIKIQIDGVP